jgi:glycosyltransferase involved in cell wall biosynthesis
MAAGLPLVVSRAGGTTSLVAEGVNGWTFPWGDVEGLTVHLRRLAVDRALARRLGAASRVRAAQFSWDQAFEKYMTLFEKITLPSASLRSARIGSSFREGQKRG